MDREQISTQIRLPADYHAEINQIAKRDGLSLNSTMLMLMRLGLKVYGGYVSINFQTRDE